MKKYLLGLSALVFAVGFSAFAAKNVHTNKGFTTFYWEYPSTAPQTKAGFETSSNYVQVTPTTYPACDENPQAECGLQTSTMVSGQPDFSSGNMTFDANGFPNGGATFVQNDVQTTP